ncbi:ATPase family AAA domain-containing protein 3-like [Dioscorea cayenensis subsp. rotundata]|uniref:ATPase family AAA domain-containing protein 3-like n=1 Tax=Dioscorea cayennensis subsp. rotundata TaxID=55577 RepID=A0AB40CSK4_DIOCR|nr:ATPase family AAA domain-containing protein 3-like [Dioscorea cayenensis subsp. rotundata]
MARACTAAAASTLAAAVMAMDRAYADGPFHFPLFSSPSSASSPAAAAAPEVPPAGDPRPKAEEPPRVRNDNPRTTAAGFDPEALVRGAEAVREIDKSHNAKKVFELMMKQEQTRQTELAAKKSEFEAMRSQNETERQRVIYDEQKKLVQQQAQTKSQMARYEDELARKRMQADHESQRARNQELVKMQEESAIRQEQTRRATEEQIQAQRRQTEREKAEIERETIRVKALAEAEGRAHEAKLAEDVNRRMLIERANAEREKWISAINTTFEHVGGGLRAILTDQNKLVVAVGGLTALAAGIYTTREGAKVVWGYVDRILGQPSLIRESSRGKYPWSGFLSRATSSVLKKKTETNGLGKKGNGFGDVILNPSLQKRIQQLAGATANTKAHQAPFRNMLFYGPPGTGKTMAARELARKSGLDYALMTGGDVAPLGPQAVTKIHQLFDWAKKSRRGLLLFIDEADAFLCERNKTYMSEAQRSALNALLFRTGDQSKDIVLALATNRPGDLDSAVADRIDEVLEFPLPGEEERFKLLKLYLDKYIARAGERKPGFLSFFRQQPQKIEIKGVTDDIIREAAAKTEGFSGREIAKLLASVQAAVYGSKDCELTPSLFREVVDYKVAEHQQRRKLADAEEGA